MGLARENIPLNDFSAPAESSVAESNVPTEELRKRVKSAESVVEKQAILVNQLSELLSANSLQAAMDSMANALQVQFRCDRVAITLLEDDKLALKSVSQQAVVETSTSESRLLVDAMREACDRESLVNYPSNEDALGVEIAHRSLAGPGSETTLCSVPLYDKEELVGAFLYV